MRKRKETNEEKKMKWGGFYDIFIQVYIQIYTVNKYNKTIKEVISC